MKLPEDPFIRELLPEFLDTWIVDLEEQFLPAYESKNKDDMYRLGHTLKGSCFQFGLDEVAELGIKLMAYSKAEEWDKAMELYVVVKDTFARTKIEVEAMTIE